MKEIKLPYASATQICIHLFGLNLFINVKYWIHFTYLGLEQIFTEIK